MNAKNNNAEYSIPMNRNGKDEPLAEYLTDALGHEAAAFVKRQTHSAQANKPWFLDLAFNAPHTPLQPHPRHLAWVAGIADEKRRNYAGLVVGLDEAVGNVLQALRASGQEQNTMVWFFSDNGGPVNTTNSSNAPLRGQKGQVHEGGIRVPFLLSWPARLPSGKTFDPPVIALDVFATTAALTGTTVPANHQLEGLDLLPYLSGKKKAAPPRRLFWRTGGGVTWAVRDQQWKLVKPEKGAPQLFDLRRDVGEANDLAAQQPALAARLHTAFEKWNKQNIAPTFLSPQELRQQQKK